VDEVRDELSALGDAVRRMHAGAVPTDDRWLALHDTLQLYPVPLAPLLELLDGVAMDLGPVEIPDFLTLHQYCRYVAGGVGLMLGPVLGAEPDRLEEHGIGLGVAMQLTNVLRDVREDLDQDRVYLPANELARFGLSRADLEARRMTPVLRDFFAFQVRRAREYFEAGDQVIPLFPDDGSRLTVSLLQRTYAGILHEIEAMDYDVFRARAYVPFRRKLVILGRAMWAGRAYRSTLQTASS
jgi:phytoene synthase